MDYNCYEFHAEETRPLVEVNQSIQVARQKRLKEILSKWEAESGQEFKNERSIEKFFEVYRTACDFDKYPKEDPGKSDLRKALCDRCQAIKCGACSKDKRSSTLSCKACRKNPDTWKKPPRRIGDRCFLTEEFQKVRIFELEAREDILDPRNECYKCYSCTATDVGEEWVKLQDIPLDGYPTKVFVHRKIYKKPNAENSLCPKIPLPGLQSSCNSTYTCRLHEAVTGIFLCSNCRSKISEWYNINRNTLASMIRRQAAGVEKQEAEIRSNMKMNGCRAYMTDGDIKGVSCHFTYLMNPSSSSTHRGLYLIGIYSDAEINYLESALIKSKKCERPSSLTHSRVYSMAFDYACFHAFGPPAVFAGLTAAADQFYCNPINVMYESFWALYFRMLRALEQKEPASVLLDILLSIMKLTNNDAYMDLFELVKDVRERVELLKISGQGLSFSVASFDEDARNSAIGMTEMFSECSKETEMTFDEIRDKLLFVNQAVVPYRYNRFGGEVHPMFSKDGLIDVTAISSLGVRCSCLERLVSTGLLTDDMEGSLCCKEYSFQGKTWEDIEYPQDCACALRDCQNLYEKDSD